MSYSTPAQYRKLYDRATGSGSRSVQQWGQTGTDQVANIQLALDAGSLKIDSAATKGGYVTPITQATLGCTAEQWVKAEAFLQMLEICLAIESNPFPMDDTPKVKSMRERCKADLELLASGEALPSSADTAGGGFVYVETTAVPVVHFQSLSGSRCPIP